jgi:hypothetical protein
MVLKNLVGTECWVLDDIILFSKTAEDHAQRLESALQRLDQANLHLHPRKCEFAKSQVQYLGYVLSENGVAVSADKVEAIRDYLTPKNAKEVNWWQHTQ